MCFIQIWNRGCGRSWSRHASEGIYKKRILANPVTLKSKFDTALVIETAPIHFDKDSIFLLTVGLCDRNKHARTTHQRKCHCSKQ